MASSPLRVALQGPSGTGKTWSALTFPNPVVIDFDNKLGAHRSRSDVAVVPFFDNNWLQNERDKTPDLKKVADFIAKGELNRAGILLEWVKLYGPQFTPDQTLIIDSWTMLQNNFDAFGRATPVITKQTGEVDKFEFWGRKQSYSLKLLEHLKNLKCNVLVTFHETGERNEKGDLTGKLGPLMDGKVKDQLGQHFTDWYRQLAETKKDQLGKIVKDAPTEYYWQIRSDNLCNCTCSVAKLIEGGEFKVPATYQSLVG